MRTSIRVIEIFIRVVETGSFVAAARSLLIDPAAVSRAVKGLEESLGILLFTRSTRVLKLTAEGKRFYREGGRMLRSFDETLGRFQADTAMQRHLKVGMGPALSRRMMLRAIPSFQDRHPQVRLILLSINDRAEIGDEGIDVLIRPRSTRQRGAEHKQSQGLVVRKLLQSPIMVCASPDYLKRQGTPRAPADLARHACLALLTLERDVQDEWKFARSGALEKIKFTPTLTANGEELREAALAGCGIVRLLACHVEDEIRSGALVPVLPAWECLGGLPIVAIYRKTKPSLSPVNAFVDHLAQAFRRYNDYVPVRGGAASPSVALRI
ncbi:MAG TPA: LysR family transcriptional regulator [Bradyrhizobium sp.]|nr:LysR family transcriptional regulator [Bradyrhizobium sp.]